MEKLDNKGLKKLATQFMKQEIIKLPDVFFQSNLVRKALITCFEIGYRYGEQTNNK